MGLASGIARTEGTRFRRTPRELSWPAKQRSRALAISHRHDGDVWFAGRQDAEGRSPVWEGRKKTEEIRLWLPTIYPPGRFADLHAAFEEGTIANTDPLCNHIPDQGTFTADVHTVGGIDIAAYVAQNHHFTSRDIRRHLCIAANGDPASRLAD
jgi:hypothetical protein